MSGQDAGYLAQLLLSKGCIVWRTSRHAKITSSHNLKVLDILEKVKILSMLKEYHLSLSLAEQQRVPDKIYHLAWHLLWNFHLNSQNKLFKVLRLER